MKRNLGNIDKIVRVIVAALLVALYFTNTVTGTLGYVCLAVAAIFVLTSVVSFCPLYALFGLNTAPKEKKE